MKVEVNEKKSEKVDIEKAKDKHLLKQLLKLYINTEREIEFPCLMKYDDSPNIILLVTEINGSHAVGTVIGLKDHGTWHSKTWTTDNLVPFKGSITLSNN